MYGCEKPVFTLARLLTEPNVVASSCFFPALLFSRWTNEKKESKCQGQAAAHSALKEEREYKPEVHCRGIFFSTFVQQIFD